MITTLPSLASSGGYLRGDDTPGQDFADMVQPFTPDALSDDQLPADSDPVAGQVPTTDEPHEEAELAAPPADADLVQISDTVAASHRVPENKANRGDNTPSGLAEKGRNTGLRTQIDVVPDNNSLDPADAQFRRADNVMPLSLAEPRTKHLTEAEAGQDRRLVATEEPALLHEARSLPANLRLVRNASETTLPDSIVSREAVGMNEGEPDIPPRPTVGDNFVIYNGPLLPGVGFDLMEIGGVLPVTPKPDQKVIAYPGGEEIRAIAGAGKGALAYDSPESLKDETPRSEPETAHRATPRIGKVTTVDNRDAEHNIARPEPVFISKAVPSDTAVMTDRGIPESVDVPSPKNTDNVVPLWPAKTEKAAGFISKAQRGPLVSEGLATPLQKTDYPENWQADMIASDQDADSHVMPTASARKVSRGQPEIDPVTNLTNKSGSSVTVDGGDDIIGQHLRHDARFAEISEPKGLAPSVVALLRSDGVRGSEVTRQIGAKIADLGPGQHLLRLTPEELGTVTFRITHDDSGVTILVAAERPEIMQMMRRHMDILVADLAESGLGDAQLEFEDGGGHHTHHDRQKSGDTAPTIVTETKQAQAEPPSGGVLNIRM